MVGEQARIRTLHGLDFSLWAAESVCGRRVGSLGQQNHNPSWTLLRSICDGADFWHLSVHHPNPQLSDIWQPVRSLHNENILIQGPQQEQS